MHTFLPKNECRFLACVQCSTRGYSIYVGVVSRTNVSGSTAIIATGVGALPADLPKRRTGRSERPIAPFRGLISAIFNFICQSIAHTDGLFRGSLILWVERSFGILTLPGSDVHLERPEPSG